MMKASAPLPDYDMHKFDISSVMIYGQDEEQYTHQHIIDPVLKPPPYMQEMKDDSKAVVENFKRERKTRMLEAGKQRENFMHRFPSCLMDQMVSDSHFFPPSLMPGELLENETKKVQQLSNLSILKATQHANHLALDLMSYPIYDVDTVIILDNSASMSNNMFGQAAIQGGSFSAVNLKTGFFFPNFTYNPFEFRYRSGFSARDREQDHQQPQDPRQSRWQHAYYTISQWKAVFDILGVKVKIITLNAIGSRNEFGLDEVDYIFSNYPGGGTPLTEAIAQAVSGVCFSNQSSYSSSAACASCYGSTIPSAVGPRNQHLQILMITDGEATNMPTFNQILDACQNKVYGDVQICMLGLSLQPKDIEWMENEECEHIRVRTIEAFEVEQFQIKNRLVSYKVSKKNPPLLCTLSKLLTFELFFHLLFYFIALCNTGRKLQLPHACYARSTYQYIPIIV